MAIPMAVSVTRLTTAAIQMATFVRRLTNVAIEMAAPSGGGVAAAIRMAISVARLTTAAIRMATFVRRLTNAAIQMAKLGSRGSRTIFDPPVSILRLSARQPRMTATNATRPVGEDDVKERVPITKLELLIVRTVARKLRRSGRVQFDFTELVSRGNELLVDASIKFDPAFGMSFRTYASSFIRRGLLDAARAERGAARRCTERAARAVQSAYDHRCSEASVHGGRREAENEAAALRVALARLDPTDAALLVGCHLEERQLVEIAAELGIPTTTAWRRREAAFDQLCRLMRGPTHARAPAVGAQRDASSARCAARS